MFRILSIDGGGIRGIIPVQVLKHIQEITKNKILDSFDMFAGTSTGGLIVAGLTAKDGDDNLSSKHSIADIEKVYLERGKEIFPLRGKCHKWRREQDWSYLFRPQFGSDGLQAVLEELLSHNGEPLRMNDCLKPVFIPSYDLKTNSPVFFKGRHAFQNPEENASLIDVCRATSAAPTYLPTYSMQFPHEYGLNRTDSITAIDGGVFMNNPTMGALVEILKYRAHPFYNHPNLIEEDIFVLSIGTGHFSREISGRSENWGKFRWIKPSIDIMMWGNGQAVDYHVREGLSFPSSKKLNYLRIDVNLPDEKFADMANSDDATLDYLQNRVVVDYLQNPTVQNDLSRFIVDAKL